MYKITTPTRVLDRHDEIRELNFNLMASFIRWAVWLERPGHPDRLLAEVVVGDRPDCKAWAANTVQEELETREEQDVLLACEPFLVGDTFRTASPRPFTTCHYKESQCTG